MWLKEEPDMLRESTRRGSGDQGPQGAAAWNHRNAKGAGGVKGHHDDFLVAVGSVTRAVERVHPGHHGVEHHTA